MIARRAAAVVARVALVLLAVAEFTTVYEVTVGSLDVVRRSATGNKLTAAQVDHLVLSPPLAVHPRQQTVARGHGGEDLLVL